MPILDDAQQIEVWDRRMPELAAQTFEPDSKLVELVGGLDLKPERALDIGCGPGRHLVWLAAQGWEVTGIDWSKRALDGARRALASRGLIAELLNCDFRRPPDFTAPFRLAVATRVFHHGLYADFAPAIHSLRRLLSARGYGVLSLPSATQIPLTCAGEWIEERTYLPAEGDEAGIPHHFFTEDEVRRAAHECRTVEIHSVQEEYEEQTAQGLRPVRRVWLWVVLGA